MATSVGYVGTILIETKDNDRIWFALTQRDTDTNWVTVDHRPRSPRAWFTLKVEPTGERPVQLAKLALLLEAMRERQRVEVKHPDQPYAVGDVNMERGVSDTFDAEWVRTFRVGLHD